MAQAGTPWSEMRKAKSGKIFAEVGLPKAEPEANIWMLMTHLRSILREAG